MMRVDVDSHMEDTWRIVTWRSHSRRQFEFCVKCQRNRSIAGIKITIITALV